MRPMPLDRVWVEACEVGTAEEWLSELAEGLVRRYPEPEVRRFVTACSRLLARPEPPRVYPRIANDGGLYFTLLLERTLSGGRPALGSPWVSLPLLEALTRDGLAEVQQVDRLVLVNASDVTGE